MSRQGEKRKREETLIEDYLTEREELTSGPRFHVPPFTIKQIEGTKTTYFAPLGEDPESQLEKMRGKAAAPPRPAAPPPGEAPPPAPQPAAERAPEPAKRPTAPAMARRMDPKVPRAFAALEARALQHAAEEAGPEAGTEQGEAEGEPAPEPEREVPPGPVAPPAPLPPPEPRAPPVPKFIDVPAARVRAAAETVAVKTEAAAREPAGEVASQFEPSRPVSFRKPFVKPDTFGTKRTGLPPLPRRVSAKELIARLRVVREGVETRDQIIDRISGAQRPPPPAAEEGPELEGEAPADEGEEAAEEPRAGPKIRAVEEAGAPDGEEAAPASTGLPAGEKSEGVKLCPSCGTPISEKNRLLVCTDCGRQNCDTCGRYEKSHMKSDVFYEYQFDWPLCLTCYEKAYTIQRMLGRSSVCYGNGNYSYAMWYANNALSQDPNSRYAQKIKDIIEKINKASRAAGERDREWRFARKHFARQPPEDPRWRQ